LTHRCFTLLFRWRLELQAARRQLRSARPLGAVPQVRAQ
jgi:hypothetical protein